MSDANYNAENLQDYIDNICEDLRGAINDLNDNGDDESYHRLTNIRVQIARLSDYLIDKNK